MYPYLAFWRDATAVHQLGYHMILAPSLAAAQATALANTPAGAHHAHYVELAAPHRLRGWLTEDLPYLGVLYTLPHDLQRPVWVVLQLVAPLMAPYQVLRFALVSAARWQDAEVLAAGRWPTPGAGGSEAMTYALDVGLDWLQEWRAAPEVFDGKMPLWAPAAVHFWDEVKET